MRGREGRIFLSCVLFVCFVCGFNGEQVNIRGPRKVAWIMGTVFGFLE
jgi:hypothetical protein